jgi:hypothetical protein
VVSKVFIQRDPPYLPEKPNEKPPKDTAYELPAGEFCTVHGAPPELEIPGIDDIHDWLWPIGDDNIPGSGDGSQADQSSTHELDTVIPLE